jgi:S-adenosylmethionine:tRNA ribosyltransferase-isomerase
MRTSDFSFDVPEELIAQRPPEHRGASRLLVVRRATGELLDRRIADLPELAPPRSIVVVNDTRVLKARLFGRARDTGARVEFLLLREQDGAWDAMVPRPARQRPGRTFDFPEGREGRIVAESGAGRRVSFLPPIDEAYLDRNGHVPLPPYIKRPDEAADADRYQTVFAREPGSAAAPTAGLHLTTELIGRLNDRGIETAHLTLHVGLGTFAPIRTENVEDHVMHEELYTVPAETARAVAAALAQERTVLAVGTTVVRALESAADAAGADEIEGIRPGMRATRLFITPGYRFRVVGAMLTNFHTPRSSLLVLVSAFAGAQLMQEAYRKAVELRYRFFSYGDAMLIV